MTKKICPKCNGKKSYMKTSSVDKMFSELRDCDSCDRNGMVEHVEHQTGSREWYEARK